MTPKHENIRDNHISPQVSQQREAPVLLCPFLRADFLTGLRRRFCRSDKCQAELGRPGRRPRDLPAPDTPYGAPNYRKKEKNLVLALPAGRLYTDTMYV